MVAGEGFPEFLEFFASLEIAQVSLSNSVSLYIWSQTAFLQLLLSLLQQPASLTGATAQVKKVSYI